MEEGKPEIFEHVNDVQVDRVYHNTHAQELLTILEYYIACQQQSLESIVKLQMGTRTLRTRVDYMYHMYYCQNGAVLLSLWQGGVLALVISSSGVQTCSSK